MTLDRMNAPERWRNTLDEPEFEKNMRREAPVFANINLLGRSNVARAAGSARSHFLDVQCSTARIKVTRGTRHFARDALSSPLASTP